MGKQNIEGITEALVQYYESAGFKDVYEKKLKGESTSEIMEMYEKLGKQNEDDGSGAPF